MGPGGGLAEALELRTVTVDDLSTVRFIHASAFRLMADACYPEEEIAAFAAYVYTVGYGDMIHGENMLAGFLGGEMVATAAWTPADDGGGSARIRSASVGTLGSAAERSAIVTAIVALARSPR